MDLGKRMDCYKKEIELLKEKCLYRERVLVEYDDFPIISRGNRKLLHFGSNNYLGIGRAVWKNTLAKIGESVPVQQASPLIAGYTMYHQRLEQKLAEMKGTADALLFSSGFAANVAVLTTLPNKDDCVFVDKLCHASLLEATRYADFHYRVFPHKNYEYLEKLLKTEKYRRAFIVSDHIFSMHGDRASLEILGQLAKQYDAMLILDEAHVTGVVVPSGLRGSGILQQISEQIIITGSLSKALQSYGGFVSGAKEVVEYLINKAKGYIYNTALPQVNAIMALEAITIIDTTPVVDKLWKRIDYFESQLNLKGMESRQSAIIPIIIGDNEGVLKLSHQLEAAGFYIPAIRYPTVPPKQAMLRISLSAAHEEADLKQLAVFISQYLR